MLSGIFSTSQKLATKLSTVTRGHIWPYQLFFAEQITFFVSMFFHWEDCRLTQ